MHKKEIYMNTFRFDFLLGIALILIGINMLLKIFFHIDLPMFKFIFAAMLIWAGISMFLGNSSCKFYWNSNRYRSDANEYHTDRENEIENE